MIFVQWRFVVSVERQAAYGANALSNHAEAAPLQNAKKERLRLMLEIFKRTARAHLPVLRSMSSIRVPSVDIGGVRNFWSAHEMANCMRAIALDGEL